MKLRSGRLLLTTLASLCLASIAQAQESPAEPAPTFEPAPAPSSEVSLSMKIYGDTGYLIRNNTDQLPSGPNVYSPGAWNSFSSPHLDLFSTADWDKLSFLSEIMFEADNNEIAVDVERLQIAYLFSNWLRLKAGRSHTAFGYYNDTYHHGNIFELTTARPYSVQFEDGGGLIVAHNVGIGLDGTFDAEAEKLVNVRLRWLLPVDGLIVGLNGMRDVVPGLAAPSATQPGRANAEELVGGAHIVYNEHHAHIDIEGFVIRHNTDGQSSTNIVGGFAELGYTIGAFTPYFRPEYVRFPSQGDPVYQYGEDSAQGQLSGPSAFDGIRDFTDLRVGVKWLPLPQLALKLEGERLGHNSQNQEIATVKAAFGF